MRERSLTCIYELAKRDPRVVYIGSDVGIGTLDQFKKEMPDRFFMEGISEAHIISMASGLAKEGYIPYVNTIATFLTRRCYEQIAIDACLQNLPVRLIANGGGLVYAPLGPTHMAIDDIGLMRLLPNMSILVPSDADEMEGLIMQTTCIPGPIYIRVAKGDEPNVSNGKTNRHIGKAVLLRSPKEVLIVTTGVMVEYAAEAANILDKSGITCGILHMHTIKPLDHLTLLNAISDISLLVTLEEHSLIGGLGSAVLETLGDCRQLLPNVLRLGIPDQFSSQYGSQKSLLEHYGLNSSQIAEKISIKLKGGTIDEHPAREYSSTIFT